VDIEKFIAAVKQAQIDQALESVLVPKQRDSFEYGFQSGFAQGLEKSLAVLASLQDEVDGKKPSPIVQSNNPYADGV
jgi:flagellar biosynthesis/type III secretory pathway protein FliH